LVSAWDWGTTAISQGARDFLASGRFAHIVTLDPDGTPHVSLAWAGVDEGGEGIVWASFSDQRKLDNLRRDPRITLSFEAKESGGEVLHPYLVIGGRARVSPGGALEIMDHLAAAYLGRGKQFPMRQLPPGFAIRVEVERVYGAGSWRLEDGQAPQGQPAELPR
jgi:PPOX class probable F420-dependent enzyme